MMFELILVSVIGWAIYAWVYKKKTHAVDALLGDAVLAQSGDGADAKLTVVHTLIGSMRRYGITLEDVAREWDAVPEVDATPLVYTPPPAKKTMSEIAMRVFGVLGAAFVMSGLGVFISDFWDEMGAAGRILITLGTGWALNVALVYFLREKLYPRAQFPLLIAGAAMQLTGWFVLIHEFFPDGDEPQKAVMAVSAVLCITYGAMYSAFPLTSIVALVLLFFYGFLQALLDVVGMDTEYVSLLMGASLLMVAAGLKRSAHAALASLAYAVAGIWFNTGLLMVMRDLISQDIAAIVTGISLMSQGYALKHVNEDTLMGYAYFFGSGLFLSGVFDLVNGTAFELLYFGVVIGLIYLCTVLQSRAILFTSICALLSYIAYYSSQYFVDSLGWPLALVLMGFAFFGVAMMAVRVRKRIGQ